MPWFWGSKDDDDDDGSSYYTDGSSYEEEYSEEEDVTSFAEEQDKVDEAPESGVHTSDAVAPDMEEDDPVELKHLPAVVDSSNRERLDSGVTFGDENEAAEQALEDEADDDDEEEEIGIVEESKEEEAPEEEEKVTSIEEKQSLLALAAEHDRVDILQAILAESEDSKATLLKGCNDQAVPPLHIAVSFGSVNATNCLLRMGADPSLQGDGMGNKKYKNQTAWDLIETSKMPPSKQQGIRHAFTAEALRCIGSDQEERLRQLIGANMPETIEIGDKNLYDWAVEMGALNCEELLRGTQAPPPAAVRGKVVRTGEPESIPSLLNRLDELESLSQALGTCLDNLGEEVAVCSGLLLLGSGAVALASHVKSLRTKKENKEEEFERLRDAWENSQDELAYWAKQCGAEGQKIVESFIAPKEKERRHSVNGDATDEQQRQALLGEVAAMETKVRSLRVSIGDLSDENTRNLAEVGKRGLSGGVNLVRGLRETIKTIEFKISQVQSHDAECRTKISMVQQKLRDMPNKPEPVSTQSAGLPSYDEPMKNETAAGASSKEESKPLKVSTEIESGQSRAIALRNSERGFFPASLWQILLRIIGMGERPAPTPAPSVPRSPPAIII